MALQQTALHLPWLALLASPPALAEANHAKTLDTIVATGQQNSSRTELGSAAPVDVLSAQDLAATGQGNLLDALTRLLPSFSQPGGYQSDQESLIRGVQVRNLSPGYTLVLVNGKRRNVSAYVSGANDGGFPGQAWTDLALIPVSAIDHVEVFRDGAAPRYGSEAIAGVVNVVLKSRRKGGSVSLETGDSYRGDGSRSTLRANTGLPWGEDGFIQLSAEQTRQNPAIRPLHYRSDYLLYPGIDHAGRPVALDGLHRLPPGAAPSPAEAQRNNRGQRIYSSPTYNLTNLAINLDKAITSQLHAYATGTFSARKANALQNQRLPADILGTYNAPGVLEVYPNGFSPRIETREQDWSATVGLKGRLAGWDWDWGTSYNHDAIRTNTLNSANFSLTYPNGPTRFYDGKVNYGQLLQNLDIKRSFYPKFLPAALDLSFGLEYQHEDYRRHAGNWNSWYGYGAAAFTGYAPTDAVDAARHRKSAYIEASTNLTERWFVDLGARYEDQSDFGGVRLGRFSTRYDFDGGFAVRGTVSNAFHAPALAAEYYQVTGNCPCGSSLVAQVGSPAARALGATPLQPERSTNYSFGFSFDPSPQLHAALDFYQITVRHALGMSSQIGYNAIDPAEIVDNQGQVLNAAQITSIDQLLRQAGIHIHPGEAAYVSYFTNIGDTRTRGLELTLEANQQTRWGHWRYHYALNWAKTAVTSVQPPPEVLQNLPDISNLSAASAYRLRYRSPLYTQLFGVLWDRGPWGASLDFQHYGPIKRLRNGYRYQLAPMLLTHISASYAFAPAWNLTLGIDNLFDQRTRHLPEPAKTPSERAAYSYVYDQGDVAGVVGGYAYARLDYRF